MSKERQRKLVGGVIVLRTFRTEDGKLDLDKQRFHLDWLIDQGVAEGNGLIMGAGGGSEGYFMSDEEWQAKVSLVAERCKGRVPSVAGVFEVSATEAAKKAQFCERVGIDFVQLAPPHYMIPKDSEVFAHYKAVNDAADVGLICYNTPWAMPRPGWEFSPPILDRLMELQNVEGVKWTSYDISNWSTCLRLFAKEFNFLSNDGGELLSLPYKLGCTGFISSDGAVAPRLNLHMWELVRTNRYDEYDALISKLYVEPYLTVSRPEGLTWLGMGEGPHARAGMEAMGLKTGPSFPAQEEMDDAYKKRVKEGYLRSGMAEWVDWKDEFYEAAAARETPVAAGTD